MTDLESKNRTRPTMREFILRLLETSEHPWSIDEIEQEFEKAGYETVRASIRGRLNTLTYQNLIIRVARGIYASHRHLNSGNTLKAEYQNSPPSIPSQEIGLSFEISSSGAIGLANSGLISSEYEFAQLEPMREVLLQALSDLLDTTEGSNAFSTVRRIAERYREILTRDIRSISIDQLYAQGIRLDNANFRLQEEIANGELPPTGHLVGEALDSVIAIHGPTVLATRRGQTLLERSRHYNVSRQDELEYKIASSKFAEAIADSQELVEPEVKDLLPPLNAEIGTGHFPERSSQIAKRANQNLLIVFAKTLILTVPSGLITASIIGSSPGELATAHATQLINSISGFLNANGEILRILAGITGPDLSWLTPFLNWWKRRIPQ